MRGGIYDGSHRDPGGSHLGLELERSWGPRPDVEAIEDEFRRAWALHRGPRVLELSVQVAPAAEFPLSLAIKLADGRIHAVRTRYRGAEPASLLNFSRSAASVLSLWARGLTSNGAEKAGQAEKG